MDGVPSADGTLSRPDKSRRARVGAASSVLNGTRPLLRVAFDLVRLWKSDDRVITIWLSRRRDTRAGRGVVVVVPVLFEGLDHFVNTQPISILVVVRHG